VGPLALRTFCCFAPSRWRAGRIDLCVFERLPQIRASKIFAPTSDRAYADDGQVIGSFAWQPASCSVRADSQVLKDAILNDEDQHFEKHWGVGLYAGGGRRPGETCWRIVSPRAPARYHALAGTLFLEPLRPHHAPQIQGNLLAPQIERHYTSSRFFTM